MTINNKFYVNEIAEFRSENKSTLGGKILDALDSKLDELENTMSEVSFVSKDENSSSGHKAAATLKKGTLKRTSSFSKAIRSSLNKSKSSMSLLKDASKPVSIVDTPTKKKDKYATLNFSKTPEKSIDSSNKAESKTKTIKIDKNSIKREFVTLIADTVDEYTKLLEFLPAILKSETDFIMQILTMQLIFF